MPQYAILLYEKELPGGVADIPPEVIEAQLRVREQVEAMGARIVNAQATQPSNTARTVHKGGIVTDGPFIESKEVLGGFFVVEARDLDQAIEIARLVPIMDGGVEVRPLLPE
jgi:hypothetical protein